MTTFLNAVERLKSKEKIQAIQINETNKVFNELNSNSNVLSVSCGDGMWDYILIDKYKSKLNKLTLTDIVDNPIDIIIFNEMKKEVNCEFIKTQKDKRTKFQNESFDLIYHHDVIEHTRKPFLLMSEHYRLLKQNGTLFFSTPNVFRLSNILRLLLNKLTFPNKIGYNKIIGDYIHEKEYFMEDLRILLEEVGFKKIKIYTKLFGLMNLQMFYDYKDSSFFEQMGHIIFCKITK